MQRISISSVSSVLDFDYGEGWVTIAWVDPIGLEASLTIDLDGHCSREMPIRSGSHARIVEIAQDRIRMHFPPSLAEKLELDPDVEFCGRLSPGVYADLCRLAELLS